MKFPGKFFEILVNKSRIFTYAVPQSLEDAIQVGQVVRVPLVNRLVTGYVLKEVSQPEFNTKEIDSLVSKEIYFSEAKVRLCEWLAEKYIYPLAVALKLILPK
jgi:primosomal protein N'